MTGFSQMQGVIAGVRVGVEMRSYNHRYLDIIINAPNGFNVFEEKIRALLKQNFTRGRVVLNMHANHYSEGKVTINEALIKDYLYNVRATSRKFKIRDDLSIRDFISLPGVFTVSKPQLIKQGCWPALEKVLGKSIKLLKNMRMSEGRSTLKDLILRVKELLAQTESIKKNAKMAAKKRMARLAPDEISLYLKATDISEELLRLGAHLKNFKSLLINSRIGVKGKELDFIAQELQREANTIAAKSQDYRISRCIVKIKAEIEKVREQVQNIQ